MCGLFGMISTAAGGVSYNSSYIGIFRDGMHATSQRGNDSFGMFAVHEHTHDVKYQKVPVAVTTHLTSRPFSKFSTDNFNSACAVIGHGRYATKGDISYDNSHPFHFGDIVLVHNGVLRNDHVWKNEVQLEVDSMYIAWLLNKEKNVVQTIGKLKGDFALIWWNVEERSINIIRNSKRSLYYWENAKNKMFIASEVGTLMFACLRNGEDIHQDDIKEFESEKWYKYSYADKKYVTTVTDCKFLADAPSTTYYGSGGVHNAHPFQHQNPWGGLRQGRVVENAYDDEAFYKADWSGDTNKLSIFRNDRVIFTHPIFLPYNGTSNYGTILASANFMVNGKVKEVSVQIEGVNSGIQTWLDAIENLNDPDAFSYALSARASENCWSNDFDKPKYAIRCSSLSLCGWIAKKNGYQYYKFDNTKGTHVKTHKETYAVAVNDRPVLTLPNKELPILEQVEFQGPHGSKISLKRLEELTSHGCMGGCSQDFTVGEYNDIVWIGDSPVHKECAQEMGGSMEHMH